MGDFFKMKKRLLIISLCSMIALGLWWSCWVIANSDYREPCDVVKKYESISNGDITWCLPEGTGPNDWTFLARDCNELVKVIDYNNVEYFIYPEPIENFNRRESLKTFPTKENQQE